MSGMLDGENPAGGEAPTRSEDRAMEATTQGHKTATADESDERTRYACPWDNCNETFPATGDDSEDTLLLTSHAYAVHNGHLRNPEAHEVGQ